MIYKYLIPDTPANVLYGSPQRHENPCYPAIPSLSRDLCVEILPERYSLEVPYHVVIDMTVVQVLGGFLSCAENLPLAYASIRYLCLTVKYGWRTKREERFRRQISQIVPRRNTLKQLDLALDILDPRCASKKETPEEMKGAFGRTLSPVRVLVSVCEVSLSLKHHGIFDTPVK